MLLTAGARSVRRAFGLVVLDLVSLEHEFFDVVVPGFEFVVLADGPVVFALLEVVAKRLVVNLGPSTFVSVGMYIGR